MHRNTLLGVALRNALTELSEREVPADTDSGATEHFDLTAAQSNAVWAAFDAAMDAALREAPKKSTVEVQSAPQQQATNSSNTKAKRLRAEVVEEGEAAGEEMEEEEEEVAESSGEAGGTVKVAAGTEFPVYRFVDGVWTVVLKDPVITVTTEEGARSRLGGRKRVTQETMRCDFLEIHAKEISK